MYGLWAVLIRVCTLVLAKDMGSLVQQLIQSRYCHLRKEIFLVYNLYIVQKTLNLW